jgi:hypothetical protein
MKTVVFRTEAPSLLRLEKLSRELKNVGISRFDVDFETCEIALPCSNHHHIPALECALKRAGFRCPFFRIKE